MIMSRALAQCEELTRALGFENEKVILAWKAFEEGNYYVVNHLYNSCR